MTCQLSAIDEKLLGLLVVGCGQPKKQLEELHIYKP